MALVLFVLVVVVALVVGWRLAVRTWDVDTPAEAVETAWHRLSPPRSVSVGALQQRILRAAIGARVISVRGVALVPSTFEVALHPDDLEAIAGVQDWIASELGTALAEKAEAEGWQLQGRPRVAFAADPARPLGHPLVAARHEQATMHLGPAVGTPSVEAGDERPVGWLRPVGDEDPVALTAHQPIVLGRGSTASVDLADPSVSRRHCELTPSPSGWLVRDLGSANGTTVNGRPVTTPTALRVGDELGLGTAVRFVAEGIDPATRVAPDTATVLATQFAG